MNSEEQQIFFLQIQQTNKQAKKKKFGRKEQSKTNHTSVTSMSGLITTGW